MESLETSVAAPPSHPHVVVVGAGFGGLYAARALARARLRVTVVDRRNHHLFQPLLYQVATSALAAPDIAAPIRHVLRRQRDTTVLLDEVLSIRPEQRELALRHGTLSYDALIVAAGLRGSYFGRDEWARHAPGLKDLGDAFEIRRRLLSAFEAAERAGSDEERRPWLTFAVVGAGPTGVELAGAIREIAQRTLAKDFRRFDPRRARVLLVEAGERVLSGFPARLSVRALELLEGLGVEVRCGAPVTDLDDRGLVVGGERIEARTVLWAAGVRGVPLVESLGVPLTRDGRVLVEPDLSVPGRPEVFVVGDLAALRQDGEWIPGMAPAAIQEGRHAAANVERLLRGEPTRPFRYRDRGMLATVGRAAAVARVGRFCFAGGFAWLLWLCVHVAWLIGFRNRVAVLLEWAWCYVTYRRSARVVIEPSGPGPAPEPAAGARGGAGEPGTRAASGTGP